jgi:hypothetical protein
MEPLSPKSLKKLEPEPSNPSPKAPDKQNGSGVLGKPASDASMPTAPKEIEQTTNPAASDDDPTVPMAQPIPQEDAKAEAKAEEDKTEAETEEQKVFNEMDLNKDGTIDQFELMAAMDKNKDGKIDMQEFKQGAAKIAPAAPKVDAEEKNADVDEANDLLGGDARNSAVLN